MAASIWNGVTVACLLTVLVIQNVCAQDVSCQWQSRITGCNNGSLEYHNDVGLPAPCKNIITSLMICYNQQHSNDELEADHEVYFALYNIIMTEIGNKSYTKSSETFTVSVRECSLVDIDFYCCSFTVTPMTGITIQRGDRFIGVCIPEDNRNLETTTTSEPNFNGDGGKSKSSSSSGGSHRSRRDASRESDDSRGTDASRDNYAANKMGLAEDSRLDCLPNTISEGSLGLIQPTTGVIHLYMCPLITSSNGVPMLSDSSVTGTTPMKSDTQTVTSTVTPTNDVVTMTTDTTSDGLPMESYIVPVTSVATISTASTIITPPNIDVTKGHEILTSTTNVIHVDVTNTGSHKELSSTIEFKVIPLATETSRGEPTSTTTLIVSTANSDRRPTAIPTMTLEPPSPTGGEQVVSSIRPSTSQFMASPAPQIPGNPINRAAFVVFVVLAVIIVTVVLLVLVAILVQKRKRVRRNYRFFPSQHKHAILKEDESLYSNNTIARFDNVLYSNYNETVTISDGRSHLYDYTAVGNTQLRVNAGTYSEVPTESGGASYHYAEISDRDHLLRVYHAPASKEAELYAQLKLCGVKSITRDTIQATDYLGSGQFGDVKRGVWRNEKLEVQAALKTLKEGSKEEDKVKFLQEAAIMAQFSHPNVVLLYGVVIKGEPMMLVVELAEKGSLFDYLALLKQNNTGTPLPSLPKLLLGFSQQVALGMRYLSEKGFVHRDLAARNILVSNNNVCKIADFGMSRDLADENYYVSRGGLIPVKWTAPEALHYKKYSTASDVWSYGCLLYEIWSLGHKPYENLSNIQVVRQVGLGRRLSPPPGCPRKIYELMIFCWNADVPFRPKFADLLLILVSDQRELLSIPQEALDTHRLAGVLGSPLEAGERMYLELQNRYVLK